MKQKIFVLISILLVIFPAYSFATAYDYTAKGEFENYSGIKSVLGSMKISDIFIASNENHHFYFEIVSFELNVSDWPYQNFSGDEGSISYDDSITPPSYEEAWSISNNFPNHDVWATDRYTPEKSVEFFTADMQPYTPVSGQYFGILAPIISLNAPFYMTQDGSYATAGSIWLTRDSGSAPVPEPSSMLLLAAGLIPALRSFRKGKDS